MRTLSITSQYARLRYKNSEIEKLFNSLDKVYQETGWQVPPGELSIAFLDDQMISGVHQDFMDDASPTDVITFPGSPEDELAGEICVSVDTAIKATEEYSTDLKHELTLYLVHGWLHLAGMEDKTDSGLAQMMSAEAKLMAFLEKKNSLPQFTLTS